MYCISSALTVPVQRQLLRHVRDRSLPAASPDKVGEALGVERIVRQKVEPLPLHLAAVAAIEAPHLQLQEYPRVPSRHISYATDLAVVRGHLYPTTAPAHRFFERRRSVITRAFGSPKIPRTVGCARKPANEYVSHSRRRRLDARAIRNSCQISHPSKCRIPPQSPLFSRFHLKNHPLDSTKTPNLLGGHLQFDFHGGSVEIDISDIVVWIRVNV